ncbi:MAG: ABC transporter permease [Lutisporaceae bacterium]
MTIFLNNLKRLSRDKFILIVMLLLPIIFIAFSMYAVGGDRPLNVAVIDYDDTKLTSILKDNLRSSSNLIELQEQDIKQKLINGKLEYVIKIDKGFTQDLIDGVDVKLQSYSLKETNTSIPIKVFIDSFINSSKNIAFTARGNEEEFYKGMELYLSDIVAVDYRSIENTEHDTKSNSLLSFGFLVMFMFFMATSSTTLVLEDKHLNTYSRVLSSPITTRNYFIQNLLSYIAIMLIQVFAVFTLLIFIFRADLGPSIINLLILYSVFTLASVALGLTICSFSKDLKQANAMAYLITIPMCMLGGCFWPREIMPEVLQQLSNFIPVTWVLKATEKLLYGSSITAISSELGILLLFALVFFIAGSNKKIMLKN